MRRAEYFAASSVRDQPFPNAPANRAVESVSVFFPCYNDAATIASMVDLAARTLDGLGVTGDIVVVNDGSTDNSAAVLEHLRHAEPRLRVVTHEHNRGYGGALISGFASATDEWVFYTDGDAQYDPRELARLVHAATDEIDVVQGYKLRRADGFLRTVVGRVYHGFVRRLFGIEIRDTDCDFRLIRRSTLDGIHLARTSGAICVELVRRLQDGSARFAEVGVSHHPRPSGRSEFFRVRRIVRTVVDLADLRYELARSRASRRDPEPVRAWAARP